MLFQMMPMKPKIVTMMAWAITLTIAHLQRITAKQTSTKMASEMPVTRTMMVTDMSMTRMLSHLTP